jgi:hypothetical protein
MTNFNMVLEIQHTGMTSLNVVTSSLPHHLMMCFNIAILKTQTYYIELGITITI